MNLDLQRFCRADYPEYAAWFADVELDRRLGPLDQEWLDAILAEPESEEMTWAVFRDEELVAVIETAFEPQNQRVAFISAVATKPSLRRQGIGTAVLQQIVNRHHAQGIIAHSAYVALTNEAARRWIERIGFVPTADEPNEHGYVEFRHGG
jgi:GNAT superfamily N-acetyltransferase